MSQTAALRTLRQALSALYDDPASIRILVDDIGLDATRIDLRGAAADVWANVLREAHHQHKVAELVHEASLNYPARATELTHAYQLYLQAEATGSTPAPVAAPPSTPATAPEETSMANDPALPYDLFISYSHRDTSWVRSVLLTTLEEQGIRVCVDFRDFALGAPVITEIERAVVQSRKTLLVLTPEYLVSQWTEFENVLVATLDPAARARRMLSIMLKPCEPPLRIRHLIYLDFTQGGDLSFEWNRLFTAIRTASPASTPAAPAVATSTAPPLPPSADLERTRRTLTMAQRTLAILEEQAAAFGALHTPAHLRIELEEKRKEVAALEARVQELTR